MTHVIHRYNYSSKLHPCLPAFLSLSLSEVSQAVPVVISCLRATVAKSANGLLVHLVSLVISWQAKEEPSGALMKRTVPESVLVKIPREWNYKPPEALGKEAAAKGMQADEKSFIFIFLNFIIKVDPRGEFLVILLPSSHRRNRSSALLHFRQPAGGLGVRASPRPLPLPRGGEAALPAFTAASPPGSVGLDPAGLPDPGPRRPGCSGTDQRSDPGQGGERDPVPAGRVPPSCCWHPAEGNAWGLTDKQGLHLE